ncbi:monooxygenase-like protein [Coniochaeta sp. PMI_546]|nr:monooxygenase-like protein [Coniochaeta sp. PMI_546]
MEQTQVIIVGAGPAGLALGLALARFHVQSVILEKETQVTTDPRGVYLTGDAIRILNDLGIGHEMANIGHEVYKVHFHRSAFNTEPFYSMSIGSSSGPPALPEGLLQIQPRLESVLREAAEKSEWCSLRTGCTVTDRIREEPPVIEYTTEDGKRHEIGGQWLVGADGKRGIVRKYFLEPTAGIKQVEGRYPYNGTWIAANLSITAPTPQSHPDFPLWELGYTPDEVYDLFWPKGWHFCCPPGKPTATGRFGPHSERLWRHEFRQDFDDQMNAEDLLWEHITPMITRKDDGDGRNFQTAVQFPRDCISILRCRPFQFTHRVVDRWFHKRTILIGDAAHVFPPFAGQGIASGLRDAHQLAWRLALLVDNATELKTSADSILEAWALERRKSVDDAALFSMLNGRMCNNEPTLLLESIHFLPDFLDPQGVKEREGFTTVAGGFFLDDRNGGARMSQIYVQSSSGQSPILLDRLRHQSRSVFTILVISDGNNYRQKYADASDAIEAASVHPNVLSTKSIVFLTSAPDNRNRPKREEGDANYPSEIFSPAPHWQLPFSYSGPSFLSYLRKCPEFVIVRPDLFVFACAKDAGDLRRCLTSLKGMLSGIYL